MLPRIKLSDFTYHLPPGRIAQVPLPERDQSRLLVYRKGSISHHVFSGLPALLPAGTLLVMNDTRVVPARLIFRRATGAFIEVLLLKPVRPTPLVALAMASQEPLVWECMVGNLKKWKEGEVLQLELPGGGCLRARLADRDSKHVELSWDTEIPFAAVLEEAGRLPLPPYIEREADQHDRDHYQTVYAARDGAVAAPTAGLHFTPAVFRALEERQVPVDLLTLHVGAGTFQPVKHEEAQEHPMHSEQFTITAANIRKWIQYAGSIIPVGTTSMRTLETAYWLGVKIIKGEPSARLEKEYAYRWQEEELPTCSDALHALLEFAENQPGAEVTGDTSIYIMPGYTFRVCSGLVTNFHMPETTLILLVAALLGEDWKRVYEEALEKGYRFLSYGDSSLLLP